MTILRELRPLSENKDFVNAFSSHVSKHENNVCGVCGLQAMGHGPESRYLGYDRHDFTPVSAAPEMVEHARRLTGQAYRNRCRLELCGAYCVSTHAAA